MEFKINKEERVAELSRIENGIIPTIRDEIAKEMTGWYDDVAFSVLKQYGITKDNWREYINRVKVVKQSMYYNNFFVDGYYAFTLREDSSMLTEWEKEGLYMARVNVTVKVEESMKGMGLDENYI